MLVHFIVNFRVRIPKPIAYSFDNSIEKCMQVRLLNIQNIIQENDQMFLDNLRIDRRYFYNLCQFLKEIRKLKKNRSMNIEEMVTMFLYILSHETKHKITQFFFTRSGETISRHFISVLNAIIKYHHILMKKTITNWRKLS